MKTIIQFITQRAVISFIGLIAISIIIWFGGPLIGIGGKPIFESAAARLVLILVVAVIWGLNNLRQKRKDEKKTNDMFSASELVSKLKGGGEQPVTAEQAHEQAVIEKRFKEAISTLRKSRLSGMKLHELPIYVMIGPPGSGKTTAIINSGLRFPLAESLGKNAIQGVGGTRNCDWWFTDEAILIDTAGRYTTQDSDASLDSAGWNSFLDNLKKHRKAKPINGAMIAVSLTDIMQYNDAQRIDHARRIKQRLTELRAQLGIDFPVYFMVTKVDLISGFSEFFDHLSREEREQVWGVTFDANLANNTSMSTYSNEYDRLLDRINSQVLTRMQAEKEIGKRAKILAFPQEIAAIKPALNNFLELVFTPSRLDNPFKLRGVYFTSGTQEGTPIDRVLGALANTFGLDRQTVPTFSGQGRSYFINQLLRSVIFRESHFGESKRSYDIQMSIARKAAYASAVLVVVVMSLYWSSNYSATRQQIEEVRAQVDGYLRVARNLEHSNLMPVDVLPALNQLRGAFDYLARDREKWVAHGGLDKSATLSEAVDSAYRRVLDVSFKPSVALLLEKLMANSDATTETIFGALKNYLMLSDTSHLDREYVNNWFEAIWPLLIPSEPEQQQNLKAHLHAMLEGDGYKPFLQRPTVVTYGRQKLNRIPLAERVYMRMKEQNEAGKYTLKVQDFVDVANNKSFRFKENAKPVTSINGFFTHNGFHKVFLENSTMTVKATTDDSWVLGSDKEVSLSEDEVKTLRKDVQSLYFRDYENTWSQFINGLEVLPFRNIEHSVEVLNIFAAKESPLVAVLTKLEDNTALSRLPKDATGIAAVDKMVASTANVIPSSVKAKLGDSLGRPVEVNFAPYNKLVSTDGAAPPAINDTVALIQEVRDAMKEINNAPNLGEAAFAMSAKRVTNRGNDAIGRLRRKAQDLPSPVNRWVGALASESWRVLAAQTHGYLDEIWKNEIVPEYEQRIQGRYPFSRDSQSDVALDDFAQFFKTGGTLDRFYQKYLSAFVNNRGSNWYENRIEDYSVGLSGSAVNALENGARIREMFFRRSPDAPELEMTFKARDLDSEATKVVIDMQGTQLVYRHGPARSETAKWPGDTTGGAKVMFESSDGNETKSRKEGAWAFFRLVDEATVRSAGQHDLARITFGKGNMRADYEVKTNGVTNPFIDGSLRAFRLPKSI